MEPKFHEDSYGYRPGKSALDVIEVSRKRCWKSDYVINLNIKGFFDNIDHGLMMKAVIFHTKDKWIQLYVERWLKASMELEYGSIVNREKGTPQGGVISPLLANVYLHYVLDLWFYRKVAKQLNIRAEIIRYCDDFVVLFEKEEDVEKFATLLKVRLEQFGLKIAENKTLEDSPPCSPADAGF